MDVHATTVRVYNFHVGCAHADRSLRLNSIEGWCNNHNGINLPCVLLNREQQFVVHQVVVVRLIVGLQAPSRNDLPSPAVIPSLDKHEEQHYAALLEIFIYCGATLHIQVLHAFHDLHLTTRGSAPSCPFRVLYDDAAGFTSCNSLLQFCFTRIWAFHRAPSLGSHHQMPASYEAAWSLPRLDFHQQVVPSLARRTVAHKPPRSRNNVSLHGQFFKSNKVRYVAFLCMRESPISYLMLGFRDSPSSYEMFKMTRSPPYAVRAPWVQSSDIGPVQPIRPTCLASPYPRPEDKRRQ